MTNWLSEFCTGFSLVFDGKFLGILAALIVLTGLLSAVSIGIVMALERAPRRSKRHSPIRYLAVLLLFATPARANCTWTWLCNERGECDHAPVCDSVYDIAPPEPPSLHPIVPPTIRPVPTPTVPPVGTETCADYYNCDRGLCRWETLCE